MKKFIIERSTANKIAYAIDAAAVVGMFVVSYIDERKIDKEEDAEKRMEMNKKAYKHIMYPLYAAGAALAGMCIFCKNPA